MLWIGRQLRWNNYMFYTNFELAKLVRCMRRVSHTARMRHAAHAA
jgi:hypothetical protein